jgi:predicted regulator of Ras-like GTPase activity (Roadblock/LC7/MglB family)
VPAGPEAALAAMVNKDAKLGLVMYELRRSSREIHRVLVRTAETPEVQ